MRLAVKGTQREVGGGLQGFVLKGVQACAARNCGQYFSLLGLDPSFVLRAGGKYWLQPPPARGMEWLTTKLRISPG